MLFVAQGVEQVFGVCARRAVIALSLLAVAAAFGLHAVGADCCRHGAEGDCEGDCAEVGAVLQQNRVLQGG